MLLAGNPKCKSRPQASQMKFGCFFFSPAFMVNVTVATHILRFVPWATFSSPGCWISLEVKQTATVGSESFPASSERRNNGWPSAKGLVLGASYVWFVFQFFSCSATRGGVPGSTTDKCLSLHCNCPETPTVLGRHTNKELNDEEKKTATTTKQNLQCILYIIITLCL